MLVIVGLLLFKKKIKIKTYKFKIFVFKNIKFLSRNQRTNNKINQTLNIPC